jgi:hypothetical protein
MRGQVVVIVAFVVINFMDSEFESSLGLLLVLLDVDHIAFLSRATLQLFFDEIGYLLDFILVIP